MVPSYIKARFPIFGSRNILAYYLYPIFVGGSLVMANWVFFFQKYITLGQIGLLEAMSIGLGVTAELPTGVFSDLYGKKASLIISKIIMACGYFISAMATDFTMFVLGSIGIFIGFAFESGSLEAFVYDTLVEIKKQDSYDVVISRHAFIRTVSMFIWMALGGVLFLISPRIAWVGAGLLELTAGLIILSTTEPKVDTYQFSFSNYIRQTKEGFLHLFNNQLREFLFPVILISCFVGVVGGVVRLNTAAYFGYDGASFSFLYSFLVLVSGLAILLFNWINKQIGEYNFLTLVLGGFFISGVVAYLKFNPAMLSGAFVIFIWVFFTRFTKSLSSSVVNKRIASKYRSTTLSSLALMSQLPYVLLMIFFVQLASVENIKYLYLIMILILGLGLGWWLIGIKARKVNIGNTN